MSTKSQKQELFNELAMVGKAVANGRRLELLDLLAQSPRTVEGAAGAAEMSVTNTSAHLQVLHQAGLVTRYKDGTKVWYSVDDDVLKFVVCLRNLARNRIAQVERAATEYLGEQSSDYEKIHPTELWYKLESGTVMLIDVRPAEEYAAGRIPGAVSIPLGELEHRIDELPEDVEIVAYCRGPLCVYSREAVAILRRHGMRAQQLEIGFPEWRLSGLPAET